MRVIAGKARGVPLRCPDAGARPTADRVRESMFGILGALVVDARVLDLFAGSGALGIEALSRGAASADFVEQNGKACEVVRANLAKTRLAGGEVSQRDVWAFFRGPVLSEFDLIFADPPYAKGAGDRDFAAELLLAKELADISAPKAFLVLETHESEAKNDGDYWEARDSRTYGSTVVTFYQRTGQ
jgi:16S rRNA (guanine966-N2)-methyltransferase